MAPLLQCLLHHNMATSPIAWAQERCLITPEDRQQMGRHCRLDNNNNHPPGTRCLCRYLCYQHQCQGTAICYQQLLGDAFAHAYTSSSLADDMKLAGILHLVLTNAPEP